METLLTSLGEYGPTFLMAAIFIFYLYKTNGSQQDRLDKMQEKLDQRSDDFSELVVNNTKATLESANAYRTLTETLKDLVAKNEVLDRDVRERMPK